MRWSENETYQFVKIYLAHENLWRHDHPFYRVKSKRLQSYKDVICEFRNVTGISLIESELRIKIKNLRSTYIQEVAKIKQRSSPVNIYTPTIKWFADWHRCFKSTMRERLDESLEHTDEPELNDEPSQKIWVSENAEDHEEEHRDPFVSPAEEDYVLILKSEPEDRLQLKRERAQSPYKIKKKKMKHRSPSTDNSEKTYRSSIDSVSESTSKEDEFDIYGKYIASQLRKMDLQKALRVQLEIQSLVSEARISDMVNK